MALVAALPARVRGWWPGTEVDAGEHETRASEPARIKAAAELLEQHLSVTHDPRDFAIRLHYTDPDPKIAAGVLNALMDRYVRTATEYRGHQLEAATSSLDSRAQELRRSVEEADNKVQKFRAEYDLVETRLGTVNSQQLADMNTELGQARSALAQAEANYQLVARDPTGASIPQVLTSPVIVALRDRESEVVRRAANLASVYGDRHPQLQAVRNELNEVRANLGGEVAKVLASLATARASAQERVGAISTTVRDLERKLVERSRAQAELNQIEREADTMRSVYEAFVTRSGQQVSPTALGPDARIVSRAATPTEPTMGAATATGGGAIIGLVLGTGFVFFRHGRRSKLDSLRHLAHTVGMPTIGTLPYDRTAARSRELRLNKPADLAGSSALIESLRGVRVRLMAESNGHVGAQTVLFTSALAAEGKSMTAVAFAQVAALDGERVLLIECDLHRPVLAKRLRQNVVQGIDDVLEGACGWREAVGVDHRTDLHWLLARRALENPVKYFRTEALGRIIDEARTAYDLIVIDSPPVMRVADAAAVANLIDTIVLLVVAETGRRNVVEAARRLSRRSGVQVCAVLSKVRSAEEAAYYNGY
jgi:capsular exopolysaccharide synthesis family protein